MIPKERHFSTVEVIEFIRRKLPYRMVDAVTDRSVLDFLSGWRDNRVRVLIFGQVSRPNRFLVQSIAVTMTQYAAYCIQWHFSKLPKVSL